MIPITVWVVSSSDYDPVTYGVAVSPEAGADMLKEIYGPPYRVRWGQLEADGTNWSIDAQFESLIGYHVGGREVFRMEPYEVYGGSPTVSE